MKILFFLFVSSLFSGRNNPYTISFFTSNGDVQSFSAFQGKKIFLVNIATESDYVGQLAELRDLQQKFSDSLVVIAFPSNNFNNEPRSNSEIRNYCDSVFHTNFIIAAKNSVVGPEAQETYQWLQDKQQNGDLNIRINSDFQKVLINNDGKIIAVFSSLVSPLNSRVISAISMNYAN